MKIALFDDDPDTRQLIEDFLEDINYNVIRIAKENPQELENIEECDALIMDVRTRNDRHAGVHYILNQRALNSIAEKTIVIFISNFGRDNIELRPLLSGCGNYLWVDKPIDFAELQRCLTEHEQFLKRNK